MKHLKQTLILLLAGLVSLVSLTALAQNAIKSDVLLTKKDILNDFHWLRERIKRIDSEKRWTYFASGHEYVIQIRYYSTKDVIFSTKEGLIKMLSAGHKKEEHKINVPSLPVPNRIFHTSSKIDTIPISIARYIAPGDDSWIYDIIMLCYGTRDSILEEKFIYSIIRKGISDSVFLSPGPNMINFAGRTVQLKDHFEWMAPDNIYCPGNGQMSWSVHSTMDKAIRARDFQLIKNNDVKLVEILKQDTVPIFFEGSTVQGLRVTYKSKVPRIFWGKGSKILLVYYIVAFVRNQFVACVLSHYEDQLPNGNVPPPLDNVMTLLKNDRE